MRSRAPTADTRARAGSRRCSRGSALALGVVFGHSAPPCAVHAYRTDVRCQGGRASRASRPGRAGRLVDSRPDGATRPGASVRGRAMARDEAPASRRVGHRSVGACRSRRMLSLLAFMPVASRAPHYARLVAALVLDDRDAARSQGAARGGRRLPRPRPRPHPRRHPAHRRARRPRRRRPRRRPVPRRRPERPARREARSSWASTAARSSGTSPGSGA